MSKPEIGKPAPDFEAAATRNRTIRLSDFRGERNVVLYFYPKDNTPGCSQEAQDFRDHWRRFTSRKTVILGVSRDSLASHERFREKFQLPFDLISDPDEVVCTLYDVIRMKNMYGKKVRGIERSTFLIDRDGILRREWRKVKIKGHVEEVLEAVKAL